MDDKKKNEVDELNAKLDKLKQGFVTELSESEDLPPLSGEYMTLDADKVLENYIIRDLVGIVETYLKWIDLDHIPLFSVPLRKIQRPLSLVTWRTIQYTILFGRTDQQEFTLCLNGMKIRVSGHFPVLVGPNTCYSNIDINDHPDTRFLVGYIQKRKLYPSNEPPPSTELYPSIENIIFIWSKKLAKAIGFWDEKWGGLRGGSLREYPWEECPAFCIRRECLSLMNGP